MARLQKKLGSPQKTESINKHGITHSPIFVILPDKDTLFAKRAQRFAHLAKSIPNKEFLLFFAHFCNAQQHSIEKFKDFAVPLSRFGTTSTPFKESFYQASIITLKSLLKKGVTFRK